VLFPYACEYAPLAVVSIPKAKEPSPIVVLAFLPLDNVVLRTVSDLSALPEIS
jgi:hypothetical protein